MVNIEPTIKIYDDDGKLSKVYDKAINKMIDQTFDIDLEQFDFDEVAKGKCKEFDDLVTKLCAKSGLGSADIYSMLLDRFEAEYDMYLLDVYGLDELEESKKSTKRSLKESHKYNNSISLFDNLYNCNPKEIPSDDFLADLLDFAETYDRDYNKKIDELIDMNCGEWFDYVIEYSPKAK